MGIKSRSAVVGGQHGLPVTSTKVLKLPEVPIGANVAEIYVRNAPVVYTRDGVDPSPTGGFRKEPMQVIVLNSRNEVVNFKVIAVSDPASLDYEYFTDVSG